MADFDIRCDRCGAALTHVCVASLQDALEHLYGFKLEYTPAGFNKKKSEGYEKGDEDAPFFSEAYLYNLLGKDNARTVLAALRNFITAMGIEPTLSKWPKPTCRHQFTQYVSQDLKRGFRVEWCENCGATREQIQAGPGPTDWKYGEWKLPTVSKERLLPAQ